jgi:hydroxymethylpyrimidine kinase / phosphomethylpyrimidine kinase / thiamine-phosphate diphosphorylase
MTPRLIDDLHPGMRVDGAVIACSLAQAQQWAGAPATSDACAAPLLARRMRDRGALAVCVVGVVHSTGRITVWLASEHARGWMLPGEGAQPSTDPVGFGQHWSEALAKGFVAADAAVIATMASGASDDGFIADPARLPLLSWGEVPRFAAPRAVAKQPLGLYAIVDNAARIEQVLAAGVKTVQLRIKTPPAPDDAWRVMLREEVRASIQACRAAGAELYVNDHWQLAAELGAFGVHLGQEDLVALDEEGRAALVATGLALGVSSHSLWELCRARALAPRYLACGPVWPTLTKAMPWIAQGLDNLAWWCRMAGVPVVAIGGILGADEVRQAASRGADGVCIVRGLGERPQDTVPPLQAALDAGWREYAASPPHVGWPHASLVELSSPA